MDERRGNRSLADTQFLNNWERAPNQRCSKETTDTIQAAARSLVIGLHQSNSPREGQNDTAGPQGGPWEAQGLGHTSQAVFKGGWTAQASGRMNDAAGYTSNHRKPSDWAIPIKGPYGMPNATWTSGRLRRGDQAEAGTRLKNCGELNRRENQKPKAETLRTGQ
jgi:hypothetical protein